MPTPAGSAVAVAVRYSHSRTRTVFHPKSAHGLPHTVDHKVRESFDINQIFPQILRIDACDIDTSPFVQGPEISPNVGLPQLDNADNPVQPRHTPLMAGNQHHC